MTVPLLISLAILGFKADVKGSLEGPRPVDVACKLEAPTTLSCVLTFTEIEQMPSEAATAFVGFLMLQGMGQKDGGKRFAESCAQLDFKRLKLAAEFEADVREVCKAPSEATVAGIYARHGWSRTERCVVTTTRQQVTFTRASPKVGGKYEALWTKVEPDEGNMAGCRVDRTTSLRTDGFEPESLTITSVVAPVPPTNPGLAPMIDLCGKARTETESYSRKPGGAPSAFVKKFEGSCSTVEARLQ